MSNSELLGQILIANFLVSQNDINEALKVKDALGGKIGATLVKIGALSEDALMPVLAGQLDIPLLDKKIAERITFESISAALKRSRLTEDWLISKRLIFWIDDEGRVCCGSRTPLDATIRETLSEVFSPLSLCWYLARNQDIDSFLHKSQDKLSSTIDNVAHLRELAEEAPAIELVNNLFSQAMDEGASDIHLEPEEQVFHVRYRVDGVLKHSMTLPRERFDAIASRIKLISGMDIAERRLPQDGRISTRAGGVEIEIRVSSLPATEGDSIVMRLLPKARANLCLDALGMESDHLNAMMRLLGEPHGIVLITGPTGSGKSTTLYAGLESINNHQSKIITVEDPVEFKINGITQVQAHSEIGYSFASALRAILRQDPDVIMIGEIRDAETAAIAIQSAMTGHLVLSTLHTNTALSAFNRLLDMGLEPFLVASSVRAVQAQRLVRRLCSCAKQYYPTGSILEKYNSLLSRSPIFMNEGESKWALPQGCSRCRETGYKGRLGIYEFYEVDEVLQDAIMRRATTSELIQIGTEGGNRTLREDGILKASRGLTSLEEVFRITGSDESIS